MIERMQSRLRGEAGYSLVEMLTVMVIMSIVFATRTGLAVNHGTVEVLHLIGARDTFIAAQFQWPALRLGLRGGLIGLLPALITLLGLSEVRVLCDQEWLPTRWPSSRIRRSNSLLDPVARGSFARNSARAAMGFFGCDIAET